MLDEKNNVVNEGAEIKEEAPAENPAPTQDKKPAEQAESKPAEAATSKDNKGQNQRGGHDDRKPFKKRFMKPLEPKEYEERVVYINRISKTVQGGRRMRFSALIVIGNGKGKYGFANCKASEVPDAIKKSSEKAKKNVFSFEIVRDGTIAHEVMGKFGATSVFLKPAPEGTGIIAGGPVRAILELSGVKNVVSKVYGAKSAINIIQATHNGLSQLKSYRKVWELRGKKIHEPTPEEVAAEAVSGKNFSKKEGK